MYQLCSVILLRHYAQWISANLASLARYCSTSIEWTGHFVLYREVVLSGVALALWKLMPWMWPWYRVLALSKVPSMQCCTSASVVTLPLTSFTMARSVARGMDVCVKGLSLPPTPLSSERAIQEGSTRQDLTNLCIGWEPDLRVSYPICNSCTALVW